MAFTTFATANLRAYLHSHRADLDAQLVAHLVEFIAATESSLDCAIYDLRHPAILAALAQVASRPHVRLRIAYDGGAERTGGLSADPKPSGTAQALDHAGLMRHATTVHERGRHLMHDKFLVRDGRALWVGSANLTVGGLELQDNNCLVVTSTELAAAYTAAFEDLLRPDHRHSATGQQSTPRSVEVDGARLTPFFAPAAGEGIEQTLIGALRGARRIRVMAFLLSDAGVLEALAPYAADPKFDIRGIYDPHGMQDVLRYARQDGDQFWFLHDPRFIAAPSHAFVAGREQDFMHNKVLIVDDRIVFTGSYNFSENAEDNDENLLAIESPAVASAYTAYFEALASAYANSTAAPSKSTALSPAPAGHSVRHAETPAAVTARSDRGVTAHRAQRKRATARAAATKKRRVATRVDRAIALVSVLIAVVLLALVVMGVLITRGAFPM